ncbi:MAG: hypothetical protein ACM3SV_01930, partial [Betaproteobacteria bacterium]
MTYIQGFMEDLLCRIAEIDPAGSSENEAESVRLLALLVDVIRPKRLADSVHAAHTLNALLGIITARLDLRT